MLHPSPSCSRDRPVRPSNADLVPRNKFGVDSQAMLSDRRRTYSLTALSFHFDTSAAQLQRCLLWLGPRGIDVASREHHGPCTDDQEDDHLLASERYANSLDFVQNKDS
jgi:hypothetical protein